MFAIRILPALLAAHDHHDTRPSAMSASGRLEPIRSWRL
jgi:hypothetical protein